MRSGDGFLRCSDGHLRWGIFGAAGAVFVHAPGGGDVRVMLQKRSQWSHEGGTWSCPGGAIDASETPLEAALREASEEVGALPSHHEVVGRYVFEPATDWTYTTVVVRVEETFGHTANFESVALEWVPVAEVDERQLHAGFAAAWPHLRSIIDTIGS